MRFISGGFRDSVLLIVELVAHRQLRHAVNADLGRRCISRDHKNRPKASNMTHEAASVA